MDKLWKLIPVVLAIVAVGLVLLQRAELRRLEGQLAERDRPSETSGPGEPDEAMRPGLERRIASLEQTVARMFQMVLGAGRARSGDAPAPAEARVNALREDVDALLTGEALNTDQGRRQLHQVVRKVQEELRAERRQQRQQIRDQLRKDRLARLAKEANLGTDQVERLTSLLDGERTQRRALVQAARSGQIPFPQAIDGMRALRGTTDQKAREFLSGSQYPAYEKMRQERGRHGH